MAPIHYVPGDEAVPICGVELTAKDLWTGTRPDRVTCAECARLLMEVIDREDEQDDDGPSGAH